VGKREPRHLKFILDAGKCKWPALYWKASQKPGAGFRIGDKIDMLYSFSRNWYNGVETPQIIIKEISKST
jgi:single-stranded-DNA-specific exonuclease